MAGMDTRDRLYIDGAWVASTGKGTIDVINANTEEVMGRIPEGTADDVDKAVQAAKKAFPGWADTPKEERGKYLQRITEGLQARMNDVATVVNGEVGMPMHLCMLIQAGLPTATFGSMPSLLVASSTRVRPIVACTGNEYSPTENGWRK